MLQLSILLGKITFSLLRLFGRRGSALPGLMIERTNAAFLKQTIGVLPKGVVIVTGTNGKTTTTKVLARVLTDQGLRVLTNETGSNFVRGIVAATAEKVRLSGKLDYDIAVFEQDEAHVARLVKHIRPKGLVALNIMRDQMDRFGEIDAAANLINQAVARTSDWLVLNANDSRIARLASSANKQEIIWFGHDKRLATEFVNEDQYYTEKPHFFEAVRPAVSLLEAGDRHVKIRFNNVTYRFDSKLEGLHNALNVTAAIAALSKIMPVYSEAVLRRSLENVEPAFGRGEQVILKNGGKLQLQLVKNPAGFTQSLKLLDRKPYGVIAIAINDQYADGRDVSWLWDVDFNPVVAKQVPLITGGTRAYDMALRLKYENCRVKTVEPDITQFLKLILRNAAAGKHVILFCTYTAMLRLRKLLKPQADAMNKEGL